MSKWTVFCLRTCVLVAVLLAFTAGSSSAEGRLFRLVDGQLVEIDRSDPSFTGATIGTTSGDDVEIDPNNVAGRFDELKAIAEALGGWDQLDFHGETTLMGEGPGGTDVRIKVGADLRYIGGYFHRVVDGALIVPDPLIPHTGYFVQISTGHFVEIDPNLSLLEQFEEIEVLVASGAPIIGPDGENQNGPIAVEVATWGGVKALFLR